MKNIISLILISIIFVSHGQNSKNQISSRDKNEYFKIIYEKCPEADILELENKGDYIEIEYLCGGKYFEIGLSNNQVIFIETKAADSEVPLDIIRRKLDKKYEGWLLDEISVISTNDTSFLKVEIIKDGLEQNLFFTTDGKWYKSNSIVVSDKWTIGMLAQSSLFQNAEYNFLSPDSIFELPEILREVSGISLSSDSKTVLCIQDEMGAVFEYDYLKEEIKNIYRFTDIGDFEDLTVKGDLVYVLRSDGNIFYFNYKDKKEINQFMVSINALDFESLTYDATNEKFLIVSKDAVLNTSESKRIVYQFTHNKPNDASVLFEVDVIDVNEIVSANLTNMESNDILFNPSAIAIHPITKDIYILSASDRVLTIYDSKGLKAVYPLPATVYYKPEGLSFFKNGDLLISSEGDKKGLVKGSIMLLKYR